MRARRSWLGLVGTLALTALPAPAAAQPVGSEFLVNTYSTGDQLAPSVASDASGNFVVAWSGVGSGDSEGIFAQRYDSAGDAVGTEFRVNEYTTLTQVFATVAADASGNFVVVWQSEDQDGDGDGIFGRRFDNAGNALGTEFRVNSTTRSIQRRPAAASDANGNFVVVWDSLRGDGDSYGVFGQRFDSAGVPQGGEFQVNTYTTDRQLEPSVASDASGNFVVAWASHGQDGIFGDGIFAQRYDSSGVARGSEFRVNAYTPDRQMRPAVASDASGNFVVAWLDYGWDGVGIFGQRYDKEGLPLGTEFRVASHRKRSDYPAVASDAGGNFIVSWQRIMEWRSNNPDVFARRFDSEGTPQGAEFSINSYTQGDQARPALVATGTNEFVVVWDGLGQGGLRADILGQRLDFSEAQRH